jgi:hypothetical protein
MHLRPTPLFHGGGEYRAHRLMRARAIARSASLADQERPARRTPMCWFHGVETPSEILSSEDGMNDQPHLSPEENRKKAQDYLDMAARVTDPFNKQAFETLAELCLKEAEQDEMELRAQTGRSILPPA